MFVYMCVYDIKIQRRTWEEEALMENGGGARESNRK